jgi:hypothetical protein
MSHLEKSVALGPCIDLVQCIREGNLIPFLNNSLRDDRFMAMFGFPERSLEEFIAENWAGELGYPLKDCWDLARVAQYHQVTQRSSSKAKRDYLNFLKRGLLGWAKANDPQAAAKIRDQNLDHNEALAFADLVSELGYPTYAKGQADPLCLLAQLPFPIYITTSYYDFLERELQKQNKDVRSQVCTWSGMTKVSDKSYLPDPGYEPTPMAPLVFHLFGIERFPETLVLSVDDYLSFLVRIFLREAEAKTSAVAGGLPIPTYLWEKVAGLHLLVLGYQIHAWDFQIVFRGIIAAKPAAARSDAGLVVQLDPAKQHEVTDPERLREYLKSYFDQEVRFRVEIGKSDEFIAELYDSYHSQS